MRSPRSFSVGLLSEFDVTLGLALDRGGVEGMALALRIRGLVLRLDGALPGIPATGLARALFGSLFTVEKVKRLFR